MKEFETGSAERLARTANGVRMLLPMKFSALSGLDASATGPVIISG